MKKFLKSSLSVFLVITIIFSSAYVGLSEVDFSGLFAVKTKAASESDLTFKPNSDNKSYQVYDCVTSATGELVIPDKYNGRPVTSIGSSAFKGCTSLTSITIPDSVTSIGYSAFEGCTSLTSITIPDSVTSIGNSAFYECKSLTSITIPDGVTSISDFAFGDCDSLTTITIPEEVTSIGHSAFKDCDSLTTITIPEEVTSIDNYAFWNCTSLRSIIIGDGVKSIGSYAFWSCDRLESITIGDGVTSIDDDAFSFCNRLESVYIKDLGAWCAIDFDDYDSNPLFAGADLYLNGEVVKDAVIPDGTSSIAGGAFRNCTTLTSITIPDSVTSIGDSAFKGCTNLSRIDVSENNSAYSSSEGVLFDKNQAKLIVYPENKIVDVYKIPDTVKNIEEGAFYNAKLVTLVLSKGMTNIKENTFSVCKSLKSIFIPSEVTSISYNAFGKGYKKSSNSSASVPLSEVHYEGTEGQWNSVVVAADNNALTNGRMHYNVDVTDYKKHYGEPIIIEPTCTKAGSKTYLCTCEYRFVIQYAEALGHDYAEEWTLDEAATCSSYGLESRHCSRCNSRTEYRYIPIDSSKHVGSGWIIDANATANAPGLKYKECIECQVIFATMEIPQLKPATPKLSNAVNTASGVNVSWGAVNGADNYIVYRREYDAKAKKWSGWSKLQDGVTGVSYLDKTAKSGMYYIYTVKANNEVGYSGHTSGIKTYFLSTPQITSTANTNNAITVKWGKVAGAKGYIVYRKTTGGWTELGKTTGTAFTDKTAKAGVTYRYTIRAYYGSYLSSYVAKGSAVRRLTTPSLKSATSAKAGITLKWGNVAGATGYIVYRKTGNGGWQKIATVKGNAKVSYLDKTAKKGTTYTYTVRAYYGTSKSYYNTKGLTIKDKY